MSGGGIKSSRYVLQGFGAVAAITLASFTPPTVAFPAAVAGLWLGWRAIWGKGPDISPERGLALATAALFVIGLRLVASFFDFPTHENRTWMATILLTSAAGGWAWLARGMGNGASRSRTGNWPAAMVLVALLVIAVPAISRRDGAWSVDVYLVHEAAAEVLLAGENPYTDAVRVPHSNPFADHGEMIEGYPYPPVTLAAYSLGAWLGGDSAWTSVLALGVTAIVLIWGLSVRPPEVAFGVGMLLIGVPWLEFFLIGGWTEPLSLSLLAVAFALWRRRPFLSAVLLGLALASKQYLILLAPVLLMYRERGYVRRQLIAGGTVVLTILPFAVWDPASLWRAMVVQALGIGFRPDSNSLPGFLAALGWEAELPRLAWLSVVLALGVLLGRTASSAATLLGSLALTLGAAFALNLAFGNYWLLVAGMFGLALALKANEPAPATEPVDGTPSRIGMSATGGSRGYLEPGGETPGADTGSSSWPGEDPLSHA